MKPLLLAITLLTATPLAFGDTVIFDSDKTGQPPAEWTCGTTGAGNPIWTVEADASAPSKPNALKQGGMAAFSWCVHNAMTTADGFVEVKFKAVSGKEDQAGGVVWRWKDGNNYYVARANALENNLYLYYTENGSRRTLKYVRAPVAVNTWDTLRVTYQGEAIQISLNGKVYIDVKDAHIFGAGKAGGWTKADSVTLFDDFRAGAKP